MNQQTAEMYKWLFYITLTILIIVLALVARDARKRRKDAAGKADLSEQRKREDVPAEETQDSETEGIMDDRISTRGGTHI